MLVRHLCQSSATAAHLLRTAGVLARVQASLVVAGAEAAADWRAAPSPDTSSPAAAAAAAAGSAEGRSSAVSAGAGRSGNSPGSPSAVGAARPRDRPSSPAAAAAAGAAAARTHDALLQIECMRVWRAAATHGIHFAHIDDLFPYLCNIPALLPTAQAPVTVQPAPEAQASAEHAPSEPNPASQTVAAKARGRDACAEASVRWQRVAGTPATLADNGMVQLRLDCVLITSR